MDNKNYELKILYSKRKTVGITVKDGAIILRSPISKSESELLAILKKHSRWLEGALARDRLKAQKNSELLSLDEERLRREAREYFVSVCERYARIMGVSYKKISVNGAKTRFGSCSSKGNINFSYRMMLYPEAAREYVAVHELCHLLVMNHSREFYKLVERYLPDYKERRKLLKLK